VAFQPQLPEYCCQLLKVGLSFGGLIIVFGVVEFTFRLFDYASITIQAVQAGELAQGIILSQLYRY
jgi:hypothetical protein